MVTSVVGTGLQLRSTIDREFLGLSDEQAQEWERKAERIWRIASRQLDITRQQNFFQMQDLVLRSALESGDVLVVRRFVQNRGDLLGLKLQFVEADRICTPPSQTSDPLVVEGVQKQPSGAPLRYFIDNRTRDRLGIVTPSEDDFTSVRAYGAKSGERMALHVFSRTRPDQTRGIPYLAPVIEALKQLERYTEAELAAAVISSFFTVFVKTETGEMGLANATVSSTATDDGTVDSETRDLELAPAGVFDLAEGESIETANPARPNDKFDPFVDSIITQIAIALEMPPEVMKKLFSSSFSAAKGALGEAWRFFLKRRQWLGSDFCDPVYEWAIAESVARGLLSAPGFFRDPLIRAAYLGATWTGPSQGQINPDKEIAAVDKMLDMGIISETEATAELRGRDYDGVVASRVRDKATREALGDSTPAPSPPGDDPDDPDDPDDSADRHDDDANGEGDDE